MLSKKDEQRSFSNGPLRDQWEKRAQTIADQCKQEAEWREKSSLKLLFSKWTYHWLLVSNGEEVKESEFRKLTGRADEEEKNKSKIKFKIVPPPPKPKPESTPPPPPSRKTAPPRPRRPKRKVEVDVFRLCWKESWMSLKPPKYLYLKAKELKIRISGFETIEVTNNRKYKSEGWDSQSELTPPKDIWNNSWKQVKSPFQLEHYERTCFQWEILLERKRVRNSEIEPFCLPRWAGTWKIMNFAFRQQKQNWDQVWPDYQHNHSKKFDKVQQIEEQNEPSAWEDSWKLSGAQLESKDTRDIEKLIATPFSAATMMMTMTINNVFLPGWSNSWLLSAAPLEEHEEYQQNWCSSSGYWQQIRWHQASLKSHHQHSDILSRRRKSTIVLLTSQLGDEITDVTEWKEAYRIPKGRIEPMDDDLEEEEKEAEETMNYTEEDKGVDSMEKDQGVDKGEEDDLDEMEKDKEVQEEEDEGVDEEEDRKSEETDTELPKEEEEEEEEEEEKEEEEEEEEEEEKEEEEQEQEDEEEKEEEEEEEEKEQKEEEKEEEDEEEEEEEEEEKEEKEEEKEEEEEDEDVEVNKTDRDKEMEDKDSENEDNYEPEDEQEDVLAEEIDIKQRDEEEDEEVTKEASEKTEETETEEEDEEMDVDEECQEDHEMDKECEVHKKEEGEDEDIDEEEEKIDEDYVSVSKDADGSHKKVDENNKVLKEAKEKKVPEQLKHKLNVPLHLQFHKLNASFPSWKKSWMVAVPHRGGDENKGEEEEEEEEKEEEDWWAWKESWRICNWNKPNEDEVVCFSTEHRCHRYMRLMHEKDGMSNNEWNLSWKMIQTAVKEEDEEEDEGEEEEEGGEEEEEAEEEES